MTSRRRFEVDPPWLDQVDIANAQRRSTEVMAWVQQHFSELRYQRSGRRLTVRRPSTWAFDAWAAARDTEDQIAISEGAIVALHDDAQGFVRWVPTGLAHPELDELFAMIGLPQIRGLPKEFEPEEAVDKMFRLTLARIYLHEQAHLFQGHGALLGGASTHRIEERGRARAEPLRGKAAARRHVCELSADHEATLLTLQLMILADGQRLRPGTLWLLIAGLSCLFQRFYDLGEQSIGEEAIGSHPPPSSRMWLTQELIHHFVTLPEVVERTGASADLRQVWAVLDHAVVSAAMYWASRHARGRSMSNYLNGAGGLEPPSKAYREQLADTWAVLRPQVVAQHFGWGESLVLELKERFVEWEGLVG